MQHFIYPKISIQHSLFSPCSIKCVLFFLFFFVSPYLYSNQFIKNSEDLEKQRQIYSTLMKENRIGKVNPADFKSSLGTYPLYAHLEYHYLLNHMSLVSLDVHQKFLEENESLASSSNLRKQLLLSFGRKKDWVNFKKFYKEPEYFFSDANTIDLQCYYLQKKIAEKDNLNPTSSPSTSVEQLNKNKTKDNPKKVPEENLNQSIQSIYLTGISLPDSCDPVIKKFEEEGLLTSPLKLSRIKLSIEKNNISLANFLAKSLEPIEVNQFNNWEKLRKKPELLKISEERIDDTPFNRFSIIYALKEVVKTDPPLALALWQEQQKLYVFSKDEASKFADDVANYLYLNNPSHIETWLELTSNTQSNSVVNQKTLVKHIKNKDWTAIIKTYNRISASEKNESMWQYWFARSHIENDKNTYIHPNAYRILEQLSRKRDYYGFLASVHLNIPPSLAQQSFPIKEKTFEDIASNIGIVRAHEFYMLKERSNASREWLYTLKNFTPEQKGDAALLAYQWGWLEQAILSASKSNQFNNIDLRFPIGFAEHVNFYASKYGIPNEWVFAIIRQESAYSPEANSSVGAQGLMQIMPTTGAALARETKIKGYTVSDLRNPELNIQLGTYYLASLRKQYNGNMLLASAAYNAGPSRVNAWTKEDLGLDIEMWIETIPYKETREYVKNILTYQIIYQHRLGREINSERLLLPIKKK